MLYYGDRNVSGTNRFSKPPISTDKPTRKRLYCVYELYQFIDLKVSSQTACGA